MASTQPARAAMVGRQRRPLRVATLCCALAVAGVLRGSTAWVSSPQGRRAALQQTTAGLVAAAGASPAVAADKKKDIPPGYVPPELRATEVGKKIVTPNGLEYEPIEIGTAENGPRDGPPRSGSNVWVKFTGRTQSFDGPIFDSSKYRGGRKADKQDYVELRLNQEPTITNGMYEALKLMKVGGKGRFVQPAPLSYGDGKKAFEGDDDGEVKEKIPAGETLYYEVELLRIVKP